jgi:hypothetical protein
MVSKWKGKGSKRSLKVGFEKERKRIVKEV